MLVRLDDLAMRFLIVGRERLFEPEHAVYLDPLREQHRFVRAIGTVRVDQQLHVWSDRLPHHLSPVPRRRGWDRADLHLEHSCARSDQFDSCLLQLLEISIALMARVVDARGPMILGTPLLCQSR